jgi:N-methylhydantoinase A
VPRIVGVDVGGTFTDVVMLDDDGLTGRKVPTTRNQADGVIAAMEQARLETRDLFLHGTTAGTNALLEETGARTALVTTAGFEDIIEIARQARPSLYDPFDDRPLPLVPPELRFGYDGDPAGLTQRLIEAAPEAIALALVRSHLDPEDELDLGERLELGTGIPVSVGAVVSPEFREYERVATTVLDAYLTPTLALYLSRLDRSLETEQRLVMTSSGGLLTFASATRRAGRLALSGPAAGAVAATAMGRAKGYASVISFDMGGTSTDVCRIHGAGSGAAFRRVAGRVNRVPSLPVRTIGAGGGSLACGSGLALPAPIPARPVMARAGQVQRSRMPTSCSATFPRHSPWVGVSLLTWTLPAPRWARSVKKPGLTPRPLPVASSMW